MSISGKMSVDMRPMVTMPNTKISTAITTKVYGRRKASFTIHMGVPSDFHPKNTLPILYVKYMVYLISILKTYERFRHGIAPPSLLCRCRRTPVVQRSRENPAHCPAPVEPANPRPGARNGV